MNMHSIEPWLVINKDPHHGTYIEDEHGQSICDLYSMSSWNVEGLKDGTEFPIEFENSENNARRIVACVNACAGIPTFALEATKSMDHLEHIELITKQRDELLSALKFARSNGIFATHVISDIDKAIAEASHD